MDVTVIDGTTRATSNFGGTSWDSNSSDGLLRMTLATFTQNFFAVSYCMA